ncbi:MAG TPA: radical SAM protein [Thermoanaerobaculia bacterium]|nr:radical SAM protein [Thermoanaerobaculia bacterium]
MIPAGPLWVEISPDQPHPVDLRWVDELMASARPHLMVRPEDELLILVPNKPVKLNRTALRMLAAMVDEGIGIAEVLAREGDGPARRREMHAFFSDLTAWLSGSLGDGEGRWAVVQEPFSADFCAYPVLSEVALTYRCNLSCSFCYAGCAAAGLPAGWSEERTMTDEEVRRVLDRIRHEARCPSVSFTGGEPTLRPGLPDLVRHAKGLGLKVNLISNGQLLDDRLTGALAAAGLDSAQLSLEGPTAEVHDGLTGRRGAFARLWTAVDRLRTRGIRVHTNTTVSRRNLPHLEAVVDRVAASGLERLTMNLVIPCGSAGVEPDLAVSYTEAGEIVLRVKRRAEERGVELIWYSPLPLCLFNTVAHGLGNRGCAAADGLLHVNPAGDVLPCSSFRHGESLGNLLRQPFEEIWQSRAACFFRSKRMMPASCQGCADAAVCQGACVLYWREVGLAELGGSPGDRPPDIFSAHEPTP